MCFSSAFMADMVIDDCISSEEMLNNNNSNNISYPLFVPRIRKGTHLKESVFPEAEG